MARWQSIKPVAVYRMYDATGVLLYVGYSTNIAARIQNHQWRTAWIEDVVDITLAHYPDVHAARDAERVAIKTEAPRYNIQQAVKPVAS